jgi:hypothetical protein
VNRLKIKKIAAVCKARGLADILDQTDGDGVVRQWISSGASVYPVECLPYLTEQHLVTILDLSEKALEKMRIGHKAAPEGICLDDQTDGELMADGVPAIIAYGGRRIAAYTVRGETWFVDVDLLEPILAEHGDMELWLRKPAAGAPYFAAKAGLLCVGLVFPMDHMRALADLLLGVGEGYRGDE